MKTALAIDIGGTKISYSIIDENAKFLCEIKKTSTPNNLNELLNLLKKIISENENKVDVIAIATAGAVSNDNKHLVGSTGNLPKNYHKTNFESLSTKPVFIENDANCAAIAEWKFGVAKGFNHIILLTLGTGVGSGIIVDGKLLKGKSGAAGEMHFKMSDKNERKCSCGWTDCFEIYASGTALGIEAKKYFKNDNATSYDVINGLKSKDKKAINAFTSWQNYIEDGIIGLCNIFDPEIVVLSGSMAQFIDYKKLEHEANDKIVTSPFILKKAHFDNNSGMIGASCLALAKI